VSYRLAEKSLYENLNIHSVLAFAGIAGPLVLIATDITAAFSNPGYNMVRNSISSLALTSMGWLQTIGFLTIGLLVEIFTAGLLFNIRRARGFHIGIGCLVFMGFGMLIIGAFRTDPVGAPDTVEGTIHSLAATVVFWLFPIASLLIAPSLKKDPYWQNIFKYTMVTGILALALVLLVGFLEDTASWFGLAERILVANMIVWVEVTAIKLLLLSVRQSRKTKSVS
jgi:hypothetical membrane protein